MYGSVAFSDDSESFAGVGASASAVHPMSSQPSSLPRYQPCEDPMNQTPSNIHDFKRGEHYRTSTPDIASWMADFFRDMPAKKISNDAGISLRAAESVKQGRNGLTQAHLENLCNNNPDFRAAWFYRCGGRMTGSPEQVAAIYRAINSVMRGEFSE